MPSIQVKDVPDEVHATLRRRAANAGMSLQEYLLARLTEEAAASTLDEVLDRAGGRAGGRASFGLRGEGGARRARRPVIVVDASIVVTGLADDGLDGDRVRARLRREQLTAPHVIDLEVASAWRRLVAAGELDERRAQLAFDDLASLRLRRAPHAPLLRRCWELRSNLTVDAAAYVALAELLGASLLTGDARLAAAPGPRCPIEVL